MRSRDRRSDRGASAMEAALVTPLLLLLVVGIIEISLLMRDNTVVASNTRIAARIASTGAGAGPGTCESGPDAPPCTSASSPKLAQMAADAIQRSGSAMPPDQIDYILVYKANADGYPGTLTSMPSSCSGVPDCVRFVWRPTANAFRYAEGTWTSSTISACFPGTATNPLDRVGVHLHATHPWVTGFLFGGSIAVTDHTVMDFEPLATTMCGSGKHP